MADVTRRSFLAGAAVTAAGLTGVDVAAARPARVRTRREEHRVVVIGSGFGGGVTALRLAQAGVHVLVLERGQRWRTGPNADTFPSGGAPDKRALWYESAPVLNGRPLEVERYAGLLEAVPGENMTATCAAGVGGGSLAYQGMTLQPTEEVFDAFLPERLDYARMDRVHFPRVARMLKVATAPEALVQTPTYKAARVFAQRAREAGFDVDKIPMPIDWSFALRELKGEMKASYTNGDCSLGVNNGGKHSVDVTYLKAAEATGRVKVAPLHRVTDVRRTRNGRWEVHVDRTDTAGTVLERKVITTKALVMAAGSLGTTRLLMRSAAKDHITGLPDGLGEGWGTNGDRIYLWRNPEEGFGAVQGGPVVFGSKEWDDPKRANTIIQASLPPMGIDVGGTTLVGFGVSRSRGRFVYDAKADDAKLHWPRDGDADIHRRIRERVDAVAGPKATVIDTNAQANGTWHPLGGACMGTVCDLEGRVHGQRGLYVIDGALIPGTTGACNPSMTIAAVAERALDAIVRRDVGTVI